ncbi:hypothetical protein [Xanthomonas oryzae]|nr:hypothetical protein [Xanthomonas oryzae]
MQVSGAGVIADAATGAGGAGGWLAGARAGAAVGAEVSWIGGPAGEVAGIIIGAAAGAAIGGSAGVRLPSQLPATSPGDYHDDLISVEAYSSLALGRLGTTEMRGTMGVRRQWRVVSCIPFGSWRDAGMWLALVVGSVGCVAWLIRFIFHDAGMAHAAVVGALIAAIAMRVLNLPVVTCLPAADAPLIANQLRRLGYAERPSAKGQHFESAAPRWLRWDSNTVLMRRVEAGIQLTCPLFLVSKLRQSA